MPYIRRYCWAELTKADCIDSVVNNMFNLTSNRSPRENVCNNVALVHYSILPYFLLGICLLMYTAQAFWQIGKATEIANSKFKCYIFLLHALLQKLLRGQFPDRRDRRSCSRCVRLPSIFWWDYIKR